MGSRVARGMSEAAGVRGVSEQCASTTMLGVVVK